VKLWIAAKGYLRREEYKAKLRAKRRLVTV
jgi:hypothetical protein